jgi:hypothetical protein
MCHKTVLAKNHSCSKEVDSPHYACTRLQAILGSNSLRYQLQPAKNRGLDRSECDAPLREVQSTEAVQQVRAGVAEIMCVCMFV